MPLITGRQNVLDVYADAEANGWTLPTFASENLTTTEAILSAVREHGDTIGRDDLPVCICITNLYHNRTQSVYYTHTRQWDVGLGLFLADLDVLTAQPSPFSKLNVMVHLDHIQWDDDRELLDWDMGRFSSIMFDASAIPFEQNIARTADFVARRGAHIVVEGACDEVASASDQEKGRLTTPEMAESFFRQTGVDLIVANLGTEHRASAANMAYHGDCARRISKLCGPRLVLHGTSSVAIDKIANVFSDGVRKVNIWTTLERDSAPVLFADMLAGAAKIVGSEKAKELLRQGLLGPKAEIDSRPLLSHYATCHRQHVVFEKMRAIVTDYLKLWYLPR